MAAPIGVWDESQTPAEQSGSNYDASRAEQSSLPNCEVVQRGVKLLGLDCAAGGGGVEV